MNYTLISFITNQKPITDLNSRSKTSTLNNQNNHVRKVRSPRSQRTQTTNKVSRLFREIFPLHHHRILLDDHAVDVTSVARVTARRAVNSKEWSSVYFLHLLAFTAFWGGLWLGGLLGSSCASFVVCVVSLGSYELLVQRVKTKCLTTDKK